MPTTESKWILRRSAIHREPRLSTISCKAGSAARRIARCACDPFEGAGKEKHGMFQRLVNLIRGFFGLFVSGLERQNPEALLEVETENLRKQIAQYNQGLASHAGLCERLMSQVKKLENEERDLRAKTSANLRANNRGAAGQYALRLQTVQREVDENRKQLEQAETTYKDLLKARDVAVLSARANIASLEPTISHMKMKQVMPELTELASGMIRSIGGSG